MNSDTNKKILEESAEKLTEIAHKLAEIFSAGYDAGFIGAKTEALLQAYKEEVIAYIDEQIKGLELTPGEGGSDYSPTDIAEIKAYIDGQLGEVDKALDEVIALQDYYTGGTFDELHEYAQGVANGGAE